MEYIRFFLNNRRLISFGFLLTFFSGFGQTFLLSLYVPFIITEFKMSNSGFGGLYALATIGSSFILVYVGKLIDNTDLKKYTLSAAVLLILSCLIMAFSINIFMIFIGLLGLRFAGQGLLSHISNTTISRYYNKTRGKALSITSLGYSSGEGLFPLLVSMIIGYLGWRYSLITNSAAVMALLIPFVLFAVPKNSGDFSESDNQNAVDDFSRRRLFNDKRFYLLALNAVTVPFLATGLFFYQTSLADYKNWDIEWLSFCFLGFAIGRTVFSLLSGLFIDKYSAVRLLPLYLLPFLSGLLLLLFVDHSYVGFIYLLLTGVTVGMGGTINTAVLAEIYGRKHLGGVRSVFATLMVLGTALSPLLFGYLMDHGFDFSIIIIIGIVFLAGSSFLSAQYLFSHSESEFAEII